MSAERAPIFVVDDDPSVRTAVSRLIASAGHDVRTFSSASEFLEQQCHLKPGCLVLDLRLPGLDGIELFSKLREAPSDLRVIFMTGFGDVPTSVQAMKSGAFDFLQKPVDDEVLLRTIEAALDEEARGRAERFERKVLSRRFASLTPREGQVLQLVLAGRLNKQIARELGISEKTVKAHRGRLMAKTGARRVAQLVQFAIRIGVGAPNGEPQPPFTKSANGEPQPPFTKPAPARRPEPIHSSAR
jgi:FixJ family two-component response regulator